MWFWAEWTTCCEAGPDHAPNRGGVAATQQRSCFSSRSLSIHRQRHPVHRRRRGASASFVFVFASALFPFAPIASLLCLSFLLCLSPLLWLSRSPSVSQSIFHLTDLIHPPAHRSLIVVICRLGYVQPAPARHIMSLTAGWGSRARCGPPRCTCSSAWGRWRHHRGHGRRTHRGRHVRRGSATGRWGSHG